MLFINYKWKNSDCWVRLQTSTHLSLSSVADWPAETNKILDSKYWPIRTTRTQQSVFFILLFIKTIYSGMNNMSLSLKLFFLSKWFNLDSEKLIWKGLSFIWIIVLHEFNKVPVHWICLTLKYCFLSDLTHFNVKL